MNFKETVLDAINSFLIFVIVGFIGFLYLWLGVLFVNWFEKTHCIKTSQYVAKNETMYSDTFEIYFYNKKGEFRYSTGKISLDKIKKKGGLL